MVSNEINVAIGEVKLANDSRVLNCQALGSCVAIILYDQDLKIGVVAHVMLPESNGISGKSKKSTKFADIAIRDMLKTLKRKGAKKERLTAKIVGGAHMFKVNDNLVNDIGLRNAMAARTILKYEGIEIAGEDTGGDYGRTVKFYATDGKVKIRSKQGEKEI